MKYKVRCPVCREEIWVRGSYDPDTNALELDDNDRNWNDACEHIRETSVYDVVDAEEDDRGLFDE